MQLETKHIPEILAALNRVLHQCVDAGLPYDPDRLSEACREFCKVICRESGKRARAVRRAQRRPNLHVVIVRIEDFMNFDAERKGTGTAEWAEVTENICRGCSNNCLYCYAAHNANRFNQRPRAEWSREEFTKRAAMTSYPAREGVVMFPSSHDITPFNVEEYIRVAKLILAKGNKLLIVSKPHRKCIMRLIWELDKWKDQIMFRFTIGAVDRRLTNFWEPGAPTPLQRIGSLSDAAHLGFATSVSIEPMLAGVEETLRVVEAVRHYDPETIWIGKMNKIRPRVSSEFAAEVAEIERLQSDDEIIRLYRMLDGQPDIRWKDSIKEVVARAL